MIFSDTIRPSQVDLQQSSIYHQDMTSKDPANGIKASVQKEWINYIDLLIDEESDDDAFVHLANLVKSLLLSTSETAARDTAAAIDAYYEKEFFPSDPLMRFEEDKGMTSFLLELWEIVFSLARVIPYDDDAQVTLVNLILELYKLPTRSHKVFDVRIPTTCWI